MVKHNLPSSEKEPIRTKLEEFTHLCWQHKLAREQSGMERADTAEGERQRHTQSATERQASGKEEKGQKARLEIEEGDPVNKRK